MPKYGEFQHCKKHTVLLMLNVFFEWGKKLVFYCIPLNDSIKAKDLFFDEVTAFHQTDNALKQIYYCLLHDKKEFRAFFNCVGCKANIVDIERLIRDKFHAQICEKADLQNFILENPIKLSYCLALINTNNRYSITPPWVIMNFPDVERVMYLLRNKPCIVGCGCQGDGVIDRLNRGMSGMSITPSL